MKTLSSLRHFVCLPLKILAMLFLWQMPGMALPEGGQVTQGQATIQQENATKLNINQSTDRAVINWNSFSIGAPEWVNFQQPSSTSATLNRVTGNTPSSIAGRLTANGQIFLINPNGIMFLPTARVDVAGLVASTLNIQDSDFMRGVLRFEQMPGKPPASVVNQGLITVKEAGFAALVAPAVQNSGVISARLGKVVLASGTTVSLDFYGDGLLSVTVDPQLAGQITDIYGNKLNSLIDNQGNITAPGGIVTLTAQAAGQIVDRVINTGGIIEAKYAENRNGVIVLSGGSQGMVAVNGELNVSGERGGKVEITGEKIALNGNALIDASGNQGGGIVNIGGDYQGKGTLPNALETTVNAGAQIKADALTQGNGGEVIVWADGTTKFAGLISAKGGIISGNGGFAEVSGKENLLMTGFADLSAKNGKFGTLLLDPGSITIQDGTGINSGPNSFDDAFLITQLGLGNVTVATSAATNGNPETITIFGNTNIEWNTATTLTLNAGQSIFVNSGAVIKNTNTTTGFNAIVFNANTTGTTTGNFRGIQIGNATLATQGGNIRLTGKAGNTEPSNIGILLNNSSITSTTGSIELVGTGGTTGGVGSENRGISLQNGAKVTTAGGNIQITGTGSEVGIFFSETNSQIAVTAGNGSISLTGTGGFGIYQQNTASVTTVSGDISYQGTGTTNPGIVLTGTTTPITSTTGNITLTADTMQLDNGSIQSTGKLLIQPLTPTTTIGLGGASGTLNLNTTELNKIQDGFSSITIGRTDGSGAITVGAHTFSDNLILQNPNGGGITISGILSVGTNNLTLKSGGAVTQTQAITANGLEILGSGTFTLTNTANNINILAGDTTNNISYTDVSSFTVGTVNATRGIRTPSNVTLTAGATINVIAGANTSPFEAIGPSNIVTLNAGEDIILGTQPFTFQYGDITASQIILNAERDITVQNTTWLTATGANGLQITAGRNFNLIDPALVSPSRVRSTAANAPLTITTGAAGILTLNSKTTGAVQANGGIITLNTNQLDLLSGSVKSTSGQLLIQPVTASTTIGIGTGAVGTLNLDNAEIGRLADGFSLITIGSATGSGAIEVKGSPTFTDNLVLRNPNGGGIQILSALNLGTNNLTLNSGGIINQIGAGGITAGGLELLGSGSVSLENPANNITTLAGSTTNNISYTDLNSFSVTSVNSTTGLQTSGNITLESGDTLTVSAGINGLKSTAGTVNLKATNDIILGTASNFGDTRGQKLVLTAGRDIVIDNTTFVQADGSGGVDLFAGRDFKISSVIASGSLLNSNGGGAPINIKVGGNFRLDSGATSGVGANGGNITITADKMELISGTIGSTGELLIQPLNSATTIGIGTGATGTLNLDNAEIGRLADGFSLITIGRDDGTGNIDIRTAQFKDNVIIRTPLGAGNINLNGALSTGSGTETGTITLQAGNNIIGNTGSSITTQGKDIILNSDRDSINGGAIQLTSTNINSNNGNIILGGGNDPLNHPAKGISTLTRGIELNGANLTAGTGKINLIGSGFDSGANNFGIYQLNGAKVSTTTGNITYTGTGGNGADAIRTESGSNIIGNNTSGTIKLTSTNNPITLNDVTVKTTNNMIINSPGSVTQNNTGGLFADGLELLGAGAYILTNPNNDITTLAGNTTNKISYTDANSFRVGTVNTIGLTSGLDIILNSISGDVTLDSNTPIASTAGTITLQAGRNIIGNSGSSITTQGKNIILNSDRDSINGGAIQLTNTTITSKGGNITLGGGKDALSMAIGTIGFNNGIWLDNSRLEADSGNIFLMGQGRNTVAANSQGIRLTNNSIIKTTSGDITLVGDGGDRLLGIIDNNSGISITDSQIQSDSGLISLEGIGGSSPIGANNSGVILTDSSIVNLDGNISITGTAGNALLGTLNNNTGITVSGSEINNQRGHIDLSGSGGNSLLGASNIGISIINNSAIKNTDGDIYLFGIGGNSLTNLITNNDGVNVSQSELINSTGTIKILGIGGNSLIGENNVGLRLVDNSNLSNNTGDIDLAGTGGLSLKGNTGILQDNTAVKTISGNIFYNGEGTGSAIGLIVKDTSTIGAGTSGDITLISEAMELGGEIHGHHVLLQQPISADPFSDFVVQTGGFIQANKLNLTGVLFTLDQSKNDIDFLVGNADLQIQYTDNNGFEIMALESPTAILTVGGLITQSAPITVKNLAILGTGDTKLTNPNNAIEKIAADTTGNLTVVNKDTLTVDRVNPDGIENANNVLLQSLAGDIVLNEAINATGDITLIADSNFINNVGTGALITTTGRFLVYATSPDTNVNGWSVLGGSQQFNTTYPQVALFTGNGFLYKVGAPFVPGLTNLLTTEPVTFTFNFNDRQWRDLQIGSEDLVITEPLLCINGTQDKTSSSQQEVRDFELPLLANNAPYGSQPTRNFVTLQWQLGEFPTCPSSD